uniref:Putative secreted protein n=1 Tax=Anopheles darlingi TaxID=43151 RepID=A0A2M4D2C5_ANODA
MTTMLLLLTLQKCWAVERHADCCSYWNRGVGPSDEASSMVAAYSCAMEQVWLPERPGTGTVRSACRSSSLPSTPASRTPVRFSVCTAARRSFLSCHRRHRSAIG